MARELSVDEFLGHSNRREGGKYLANWKEDGEIEVWWHMGSSILALWRHSAPMIVTRTDEDGEETTKLIGGVNFTCVEDEETLQNRKRDKSGARLEPYTKCPVCKFLEWVRGEIDGERLSWTDVIFRWEHEDADEPIEIHAGGACNMFAGWNLSDEEKHELKEAGISPKEAWKENMVSRLSYAIAVVDPGDVEAGVQTAFIPNLLGDKIKTLVRKEISRYGGREKGQAKGHPHKSPYLMKWEYHEKQRELQKRYDATRLDTDGCPPDVMEVLKSDAPDWSNLKAAPRWSELRANLEGHCLIEVPWGEFFDGVEDEDTSFPHGANEKDEKPKGKAKANGKAEKPAEKKVIPKAEPEVEIVACDYCDKPMKITDPKCKHCGKVYEVVESKPAEAKLPKRSEAKGKPLKKAPPPPPSSAKDVQSDDIDF